MGRGENGGEAETAEAINIRRLDEQSLEFESDSLLSESTDEIDSRNRQISDFEMGRLSTMVAGSATGSAADCQRVGTRDCDSFFRQHQLGHPLIQRACVCHASPWCIRKLRLYIYVV